MAKLAPLRRDKSKRPKDLVPEDPAMQIIRENKAKIQEMRQANKILKEELVGSASHPRE